MIQSNYDSTAMARMDYDLNSSLQAASTAVYRLPSTAYAAGDVRLLEGRPGVTLRALSGGTTAAGAFPYSEAASSVTDGGVTWAVFKAWAPGGGTSVAVTGTTITFS